MKIKILPIIKVLVVVAVFVWYGVLLAKKIDLTTADLGRHIINGSVILHGSNTDRHGVLTTNFYSYTLPNEPFVNHHWLSGVVFYLIHLVFGFSGLSVFYILLGLLTFWLFFQTAKKAGGFWLAVLFALWLMPLISSRAEVRPEMFTYLFSGGFYYLLSKWREGRLLNKWLFTLPAIMLFWVNLHIGFVFGFLILGAFGLEQLIKYFKHKPNGFIQALFFSAITLVAALFNPFGYKALLYPVNIFKNYGYLIVENQSIKFLENLGFYKSEHFLLIKMVMVLCLILVIISALKNWRRLHWPNIILVSLTGAMAYLGIRHFPSFAFFVWPFLVGIVFYIVPFEKIQALARQHLAYKLIFLIMSLATVVAIFIPQWQTARAYGPRFGLGLLPNNNKSAEFFIDNELKGPVFNDYDIGGYLIYYLYPKEKVFVDNRPEAYTTGFFENDYKAPQQYNDKWEELDKKYDFQVIFFSHRDYTPWAQQFLTNRIQDNNWIPVFVDSYNIIFLKKNKENIKLIQKYYIPKENFRMVGN